jgi:two-component system alkaline phosphatase synthesis response regulator PhoP
MQKRILLCDDEIHILRAAEFKFTRSGFSVQCACNGEEAWAFIEQQPPHIVVTDCQMPRLNGLELARRIKNCPATSHLPVIMLSAKGFELSADQLREEYGVLKLLCKPFSPRELFGVVEGLLEGQDVIAAPVISGIATSVPAAVSQWL